MPESAPAADRGAMNPALRIGLVGLWALWSALLGVIYVFQPPCPDHSVFDYIAWVVNQGGTMYVDAADQNFPGQVVVHQVSTALFGHEIWSYRLFDYLVLLPLGCAALFFYLRRFVSKSASWWVIPVYQALYVMSGYWSSGQRDFIVAPLLVLAATALQLRCTGGSRWWLLLEGLCLALTGLVRPTLLIAAPLLTFSDIITRGEYRRSWGKLIADHALVALASVATLLLAVGWAYAAGFAEAWYEISILFNLEVYSGSKSSAELLGTLFSAAGLRSYFWMLAVSGFGIYLTWRRSPAALWRIGALLPAYLISYLVQGKGLGYHLTGLYALHAMMIAMALDWSLDALRQPRGRKAAVAVACVIFAVVGLGLHKKVHGNLYRQIDWLAGRTSLQEMRADYYIDDDRKVTVQDAVELAAYVEQNSSVDARVLFWGRPALVNYLAGRRSPIRPAGHTMLIEPTPDFSRYEAWYVDLQRRFAETPPELILLIKDDAGGHLFLPAQPGPESRLFDILIEAMSDYRLEHSVGEVDVFRLRR